MRQEISKVFRKTAYLIAVVLGSFLLTLVILSVVFALTWIVSLGDLKSPIVSFFLAFVDYESVVIFALSLLATLRHAPTALERLEN